MQANPNLWQECMLDLADAAFECVPALVRPAELKPTSRTDVRDEAVEPQIERRHLANIECLDA